MWKCLNESVEGTSHRQGELGCQDSSFVSRYTLQDEEILILACADGAGSASEAKTGATLACDVLVKEVVNHFESGGAFAGLSVAVLRVWAGKAHAALEAEAKLREIAPRELACTLLFAVLGTTTSAFAQIGDGAIVILEDGRYRPVFWPQSGEYQNTTFFISDAQFDEPLLTQVLPRGVEEIAMFTDGLQMLALNFANKAAHEPFFSPMFKALREAADTEDLIVPMRQFLDSRGVNDRTDDDKTLILAARVPRADATV
jgi:hypothetical protein